MMRMYAVMSPIYEPYGGEMEPPEPTCDFLYVCARNARRAKVLAVRAWRRRNAGYLVWAENPFTGVKTQRLDDLWAAKDIIFGRKGQ